MQRDSKIRDRIVIEVHKIDDYAALKQLAKITPSAGNDF